MIKVFLAYPHRERELAAQVAKSLAGKGTWNFTRVTALGSWSVRKLSLLSLRNTLELSANSNLRASDVPLASAR